MRYENILKYLIRLAVSSGKYLQKNIKRGFSIDFKGEADMVTDVDKKVQEYIFKKIKRDFPSHKIIAEENDFNAIVSKNDFVWIIDPVDGTTNLVHSYPFYCVSIAFSKGKNIIAGAIYDPVRRELFYALKHKGSFLNGEKITVSQTKLLKDSVITTGFSYNMRKGNKKLNSYIRLFKEAIIHTQGVRRDGAAALDFCYVACGRIDGFYEEGLNPWDVAAGMIIVEEAGGKITDFYGRKASYDSKSFVATNGKIQRELVKLTKKF